MHRNLQRRQWHRNTQQHVLLEYANLKQTCPEGIYLSLTPNNPLQWSCVLFVRDGPYAPAILRFVVAFPSTYPDSPPLITFSTDIFHPLVTPLTTYTYTSGSVASDATSASDEERLAPGGFGLRHAFPQWFARPERSTDSSIHPSRNTSRSTGQDAGEGLRFKGFDVRSLPDRDHSKHSIADVLKYVKRAFSDEAFLDQLPSEAAVNAGAWKAWRAHRRTLSYDSGRRRASIDEASAVWKDSAPQVTKSQAKHPDEWSWDGVWEARVRKGIDTSVSDHVLFGAGDDEVIRFSDLSDDTTTDLVAAICNASG